MKTTLFVVFNLLSLINAADICKTSSFSQLVVDSLTDVSAYATLTTPDQVYTQLASMDTWLDTLAGTNHTRSVSWGGLLIGFSSGELYGVLGLQSAALTGNYFVTINPVAFGDTYVHFGFLPNVTASAAYSNLNAGYDFMNSEWFTKATASLWGSDNWSVNPLAADQMTGITNPTTAMYAYRKTFSSPRSGVIVGFRLAREKCGSCLNEQIPQFETVYGVIAQVPSMVNVTSVSAFQQYIDVLLPIVVANSNSNYNFKQYGYVNLIVASDLGSSFMIKDCGFMQGGGSAQCSLTGTNRYQLWVTAPAVYGNKTRQVYQINTNGALGAYAGLGNSPAAPSGIYDVTTRGFFMAASGISNINSVADATLTLNRRFVLSSNYENGNNSPDNHFYVAGGEFVDADEQGRVCGVTQTTSSASAFVLTIPVGLVLAAVLFCQ